MRDAIGPTAAFDARFGAETQCYRSPGERPERHKRTAASKPRPAARYLVSNLKSEHPYYTREMKATRNDKYIFRSVVILHSSSDTFVPPACPVSTLGCVAFHPFRLRWLSCAPRDQIGTCDGKHHHECLGSQGVVHGRVQQQQSNHH